MSDLADLLPEPTDISVKVAKVLSVALHALVVDLGGPVQVQATDDCNPRPNDYVLLLGSGTTLRAIGVVGGPYRQAVMTVTGSTSTTVTGVINGASTTIPKSGTFTVTNGQVCPLFWSADGARVWCLPNEQQATAPPPDGSGGTGGPGGVSSGTAVYPATSMATWFTTYSEWRTGYARPAASQDGLIFYGAGRFRELQGRTLTSCRVFLPKSAGPSSTVSVGLHNYASRPGGAPVYSTAPVSRVIGSWVSLPTSFATALVGGDGSGGIMLGLVSGDALINSGGQLEIGWRI